MSLINKKFLSDIRLNYLVQALNVCFGFFTITIVIKHSDINVYGMLTIIMAVGATLTNFIGFRTNEAVVRYFKRGILKNNRELQFFSLVAGSIIDVTIGVLTLIIMHFFAGVIAFYLLKDSVQIEAVELYSILVAQMFLRSTGYGILTAKERFKQISIISALEQMIKMIIFGCGALVLYEFQLDDIMILMLIAALPFTVFFLYVLSEELSRPPIRRWLRARWFNHYLRFSLSTFSSSILKSGHKNLDELVLGYYSNSATVGIYNLFKKFIAPLSMLATPYASQIYPKFVEAFSNQSIEAVQSTIQKGSRTLTIHGCLIMLPILPVAYMYFSWNKIDVSKTEYIAFFILLFSSFILQRLWWARSFSLATKPQLSIAANAIALVATCVVLPILISLFSGILGVVISIFIINIYLHLFWIRQLHKYESNLLQTSH